MTLEQKGLRAPVFTDQDTLLRGDNYRSISAKTKQRTIANVYSIVDECFYPLKRGIAP